MLTHALANPHTPVPAAAPEYNPEDPEIIDLLSRDPRKKGEGAQHPFQSAMDDCLMITIKGIAAGGLAVCGHFCMMCSYGAPACSITHVGMAYARCGTCVQCFSLTLACPSASQAPPLFIAAPAPPDLLSTTPWPPAGMQNTG